MGYSQITSVEVFNFMVYSHAMMYFDESNIINIKGYNNSGKSTIEKAVAVCLTNMYPKAQTKLIRHGEKYFRIVVNFDDGVSITRDKYISGQSLYEMYKDGERIFTTKEGERLTKVDEVPQIIQDYLGLCSVSTGCLNYQVRQDPLWLIDTTGSENYTALNEILKTEEISRANALLNSDKNKLNSEITQIEAARQEVHGALVEAREYSSELLKALQSREAVCQTLKTRYYSVAKISDILSELSSIKSLPEVQTINSVRYEAINRILNGITEYRGMKVAPEVSKIECDRLTAIDKIGSIVKGIPQSDIPDITLIDAERDIMLSNIIGMLNEVLKCNSEVKALGSELADVSTKLTALVTKAKNNGIRFVRCENCGTYIEVVENEE